MANMDPFIQVEEDGKDQIKQLYELLKNNHEGSDQQAIESQIKELSETIEDLGESIDQIKRQAELYSDLTEDEIHRRATAIAQMELDYRKIQSQWAAMKKDEAEGNPFVLLGDVTDNEVQAMNQLQMQEEMRYQDEQLDGVYSSVQRINEQAQMIGGELEDQSHIIHEFEQDMDRTQSRLGISMKRLNKVLEKSKERYSDCCIVLLIVALIILLVLIAVL